MLKLSTSSNIEIKVNGKSPCFKGTPFEGLDFEFTLDPVTRTKYAAKQRKHSRVERGTEIVDNMAVQGELFMEHVKGWTGIADENGVERTCDVVNKKAVIEHYMVLVAKVVDAAMDEGAKMAEASGDEAKN